jgi:protein tyrosine phosphatase
MAIEPINISFQNQNLTCLDGARIWINKHPTTIKILKIVGLILSIGLLASIPLAIPLGIKVAVNLAVVSIATIIASLILFAYYPKVFSYTDTPRLEHKAVESSILTITSLWLHLGKKSKDQLAELDFLPVDNLNHRFIDIRCPKKTAVSIAGHYLHANKVGEGIAKRIFIASQAPLKKDNETFWKAIFESDSTIFDLTTLKDQREGGVTKYYPNELNKTIKYGSISVKLIEVNGHTYTYQAENSETGAVKNIKRCHYADWIDFGAVSLPALCALIHEVETLSPNPKDLVWIHCRAGVGRTGTLITALILKEKIESGEINKDNLDNSIVDLIIELRKQRGPAFVQQKSQLDLIRKYGNFLIKQSSPSQHKWLTSA